MKNHGDLRALIRSMTGPEKRYFKLNASRNGKSGTDQYMMLFDALDKDKILKWEKGKIPAVTAAYLYSSVLRCLDTFHEKNSINSKIDRQIKHGTVLYNRGLNKQALVLFNKVEIQAQQQQDFTRLQSIYWYLRSILAMNVEPTNSSLTMKQVLERNLHAAKELELIARLHFVQHEFQQTVAKAGTVTEKMLAELKVLFDSEAMQEVNDQSGFFCQIAANHIKSQYYLLSNDIDGGFKQGKKVFDLCYSHRTLLQERGRMMIASANNYLMRCIRAEEYDEMKRVLEILEKEKSKDVSVEMIRLETYYSNLLSYHIVTEQFNNPELLVKVEKDLNEHGTIMNQTFLMYIFSLCSQYSFYGKDFRGAIKWINLFLNHENRASFTKNLSIAYDYRLLIYYEQGKLELIESLLNANDKQQDSQNEFPLLRNALRGFLRNELNHGNQHVQNLTVLKAALNDMRSHNTEMEAFEFFPFDEWVNTKLSGS
ncbi:MAG: hypothetical protein ACI9EQ_001014 [Bacteroidia bacterium]|jgi:hypothetical protein